MTRASLWTAPMLQNPTLENATSSRKTVAVRLLTAVACSTMQGLSGGRLGGLFGIRCGVFDLLVPKGEADTELGSDLRCQGPPRFSPVLLPQDLAEGSAVRADKLRPLVDAQPKAFKRQGGFGGSAVHSSAPYGRAPVLSRGSVTGCWQAPAIGPRKTGVSATRTRPKKIAAGWRG